MVSHNPFFHGTWTMKRFNATVVNDIWPEVLFFSLIATMVTLVSKLTPHQLIIPSGLLTVLGTVLGLVISFRTSSAYERYQEGRKMWSNIMVASRNLAMMIWIHVPTERDAEGVSPDQTLLKSVLEKKTMINLIQAYSVSVKHFLRSEPGVYYQDLYPLICFLPRYATANGMYTTEDKLPLWSSSDDIEETHMKIKHRNSRSATDSSGNHPQRTESVPLPEEHIHAHGETIVEDNKSEASWFRSLPSRNGSGAGRALRRKTFDPEKLLPEVSSFHPLKPARNPPPMSVYDYFPVLRFFKWCVRTILRRAQPHHDSEIDARLKRKRMDQVESNVPLEVCMVLSSYTSYLMHNNLLQPSIATGVTNNISVLQDTTSNLERIRNTPLPFAYQAHLRMSLWMYLLFLPFQIYDPFGYLTIPGTAFASFLLFGFLEIGQEIENPFNYDLNDLDLDHFCLSIQRELHEITACTSPEPSTFIFSPWNHPFAPADRRNAADLLQYESKGYAYNIPHRKDDGPEPGLASVRRTLLNSWREVDRETRHA